MLADQKIDRLIELAKPFVDTSLDPLCIVDNSNKIVYFNHELRVLFDLDPKDLRANPCFCDILKMDICNNSCQLEEVLKQGVTISHECISAKLRNKETRIKIKVFPIKNFELNSENPGGDSKIGAVIQIRDLSQQILTESKYRILVRYAAELTFKTEEIKTLKETLIKKAG